MSDFFRTIMGRTFYEVTLPGIARELKRLNDNLERLCACVEQRCTTPTSQEEPTHEGKGSGD